MLWNSFSVESKHHFTNLWLLSTWDSHGLRLVLSCFFGKLSSHWFLFLTTVWLLISIPCCRWHIFRASSKSKRFWISSTLDRRWIIFHKLCKCFTNIWSVARSFCLESSFNFLKFLLFFLLKFLFLFLHFLFCLLHFLCLNVFHFFFYLFDFLVSFCELRLVTVFVSYLDFCHFFIFQLGTVLIDLFKLILKFSLKVLLLLLNIWPYFIDFLLHMLFVILHFFLIEEVAYARLRVKAINDLYLWFTHLILVGWLILQIKMKLLNCLLLAYVITRITNLSWIILIWRNCWNIIKTVKKAIITSYIYLNIINGFKFLHKWYEASLIFFATCVFGSLRYIPEITATYYLVIFIH